MKKLLEAERHKIILASLNEKENLSYDELENILQNVSIATIRRDINKLHSIGKLGKTVGGIVQINYLNYESSFAEKFGKNVEMKKEIAKKASKFISENDFIFLDAGTTTYYMIDFFENKNLTVVTNGITHIDKLAGYNIKTILIGGEVKLSTKAVIGAQAISQLDKYVFDKSFIGVNGIDLKYGYTTQDENEGIIKEKVIHNSLRSYVLADESKFECLTSISFGKLKACKIIGIEDSKYKNKYQEHILD